MTTQRLIKAFVHVIINLKIYTVEPLVYYISLDITEWMEMLVSRCESQTLKLQTVKTFNFAINDVN